jgi:hypothetical protein
MMTPLRYVVLYHDGVADPHYDLMFEVAEGGALSTFRSSAWPIVKPTQLVKLDDHRREYLDYEGPISGDRGFVRRVQGGTYKSWPQWDDPYVCDVWIETPEKDHLYLLSPPTYEWTFEPAT